MILPDLLHTGRCGLHILHRSFKVVENATDRMLGKTLKPSLICSVTHLPGELIIQRWQVCLMQPSEFAKTIGNCRRHCQRNEAKNRSGGTKANQKRDQEEQKKETEKLEQKKDREKVELGIKETKSMKEDLQKVCSQLEKDF